MSEGQTINVRLNGKDREIDSGLSVQALVESLDLNPKLIVVELNREILSRDCFSEIQVAEGDQVELVHFVGGG
jgi:thiamine biosynthesis protein ThiS